MRRVVTGMAGGLALTLGLFGTAMAGSIGGAACPPAGSTFTVTTAVQAGQINEGFNCPGVFLVINFSLTPPFPGGPQGPPSGPGPALPAGATIVNYVAKTITVSGPAAAADRIQIVNNNAGSQVTFTAVDGDITLNGATIKAHKILKFTCTEQAPPCKFTSDNSDVIAATSFDNPQAGGGLFFNIFGDIDIKNTTVHGGDTLEMESVSSFIRLICGGGPGGCTDPLVSKTLPQCFNAQGQFVPCTVTFNTADQLKAVCFPAGEAVSCNGGHKEKRFTAGTFIDFTGSTITADEHVTFTCKGINFPAVPNSGDLLASGATFDMDSLVINCKGKVDITKSHITMAAHLTINSGLNCPANTICIDASEATIIAKPVRWNTGGGGRIIDVCGATFTLAGSGFPSLNGGTSPPYGATVLDTAVECAPLPATVFLN